MCVEKPLPHADAAWERRGLLGRLPTHPALSPDPPLYKGRTIRQPLTEKETMRRTGGDQEEGDCHQCPPPPPLPGQRGLESVRWEQTPFSLLLLGKNAPFLGALGCGLPCPSGRGHPPDLCPPPQPSSLPTLQEALPTTSSLITAITPPLDTS